ncbi:MAG: DUF92 domain-containing protein [Candidatus Thermoplasmatota archaeon]|jgi:uncharacterized protein (TIGR00297 family)|nr:DUF92 domain-containing protein [Candidatus Thermoplasmatota archaeon]MCL6002103.1 DUF92 domain-containing protein [Candidatus Thermoplasmatota archaeon]
MDEYNLVLLVLIPLLFVMGLKIKAFSREGAIAAGVIGSLIIIGGGWLYFVMLFLFLGLSYISTLAGFEKKRSWSLQEGLKGERGAKNVLAAGALPAAISLLSFWNFSPKITFFLYLVALGTILSDTAASEIGSLDENTYMILTLRPAETGINGGISVLGTVVSFVFPVFFSVLGFVIFGVLSSTPLISLLDLTFISGLLAFAGCLIDSVLGETLENRGYLTKYSVNFLSALFATIIGILVFFG